MKRLILRISLFFVGLTGIFGIFVLVCPWGEAVKIYKLFGIDLPESIAHPYLEYLTYLGATLSVMVGSLYALAGIWPDRHSNIIGFLGWWLLGIGIIVLIHGLRLDLPPWPFYPDPIISFLFAATILAFQRYSNLPDGSSPNKTKQD